MQLENSDSFELITDEEILTIQKENQTSILSQSHQTPQMYPSLDDEENQTISIQMKNQEDELFMEPVRKSSITFEGWNKEDDHGLKEVSLEQLTKTMSISQDAPYQFENHNNLFNESLFTDRKNQYQKQRKQVKHQEKIPQEEHPEENVEDISNKLERKSSFIIIDLKKIVKIVQKKGIFFWELNFQIEINENTIQVLYDQMMARECFIPIFTIQLYKDWVNLPFQEKISSQNHKYKIFRGYLHRYTSYLNENRFYHSFCNVLTKIRENLNYGSGKKIRNISLFNFDIRSFIESLKKMISLSKIQLLRKTILSKINTLEISLKYCRKYKIKEEINSLQNLLEYNWQILSSLDFLMSLQSTQDYCLKKYQSHSENVLKIFWTNYRTSIKQSISIFSKEEDLESIMI